MRLHGTTTPNSDSPPFIGTLLLLVGGGLLYYSLRDFKSDKSKNVLRDHHPVRGDDLPPLDEEEEETAKEPSSAPSIQNGSHPTEIIPVSVIQKTAHENDEEKAEEKEEDKEKEKEEEKKEEKVREEEKEKKEEMQKVEEQNRETVKPEPVPSQITEPVPEHHGPQPGSAAPKESEASPKGLPETLPGNGEGLQEVEKWFAYLRAEGERKVAAAKAEGRAAVEVAKQQGRARLIQAVAEERAKAEAEKEILVKEEEQKCQTLLKSLQDSFFEKHNERWDRLALLEGKLGLLANALGDYEEQFQLLRTVTESKRSFQLLKEAVQEGGDLSSALQTLEQSSKGLTFVRMVIQKCPKEVRTMEALREELRGMDRPLVKSSSLWFVDKVKSSLQGGDRPSVLSDHPFDRAEYFLEKGNLPAALQSVRSLPPSPSLISWQQKVEERLVVQQSLQLLDAELLSQSLRCQ